MTQSINADAARNGRVIQAISNSAIKDNLTKTALGRLTAAWPLVIFLLLPALTRAETAVQAWVQLYNGPGNGDDQAKAVVVDGSNDVIVTGYSRGSGGYYEYATIKYSSAGIPLWTNRYDGPGNSTPYTLAALAVDGSNSVIVTGCSSNGSNDDYATIKYTSAGVPLWTNRYNGSGNDDDQAKAVVVDGSNNVIVTGYSVGAGSYPDYLTIKYSSAGVPLWTNRYNGPGNSWDQANAVAVDGSNNVIVTGYAEVSGSRMYYQWDYVTIKYSSEGMPLWTNRYNGPGNDGDLAYGVAVDGNNDVIVTGYSLGSGGYMDYATIKYSSAGVPLWTNLYNGLGDGNSYARAVTVDGSDNVTVTGYSCTNGMGNADYATIKYSSAGVPLWTNRYNGPGNGPDQAYAVAVDASGSVIVMGYSAASGTYPIYHYDYATIKYSSAGVPLWTNRYNMPGNGSDRVAALALDHSGNVIVAGYSTGSGGNNDFATVKYICVPSPVVSGLQLTNGAFQMRVDDVLQPGTLVIEAATNLSTKNWTPVFTNTTPTNVLYYTDPDAGNGTARFYRAFQFP